MTLLPPRTVLTVAAVGLLATLVGTIAGVLFVRDLGGVVGGTLQVTDDALAAVDDSLGLTGETLVLVLSALTETEETARGLSTSLDDGATLLGGVATLTRDDLAESLSAVEASLPAVIQVADAVDTALSALSALPVVEYDPDEPFDEALRDLDVALDGTGARLRDQADLIDDAGENLGAVSGDAVAIADDVARIADGLDQAADLLAEYERTAGAARSLAAEGLAALQRRTLLASIGFIALGCALASVQGLWAADAWRRRAQERAAASDAPDGDGSGTGGADG